ncbi:cysteine-rich motor neuron 1 protein-like isoform X1 [Petromyzon marinus]|uniref:cysteine-rich motor neuron 1 protein-like isoform X1 n=1 Tax=Petromyzon marinus TaxID=7757 RepID=UPI003F6EE7E5
MAAPLRRGARPARPLLLSLLLGALLGALLVSSASALSCLCDRARCEAPRGCAGGTVPDVCHCCHACAKQVGEACGGMYDMLGTCDRGLRCAQPLAARFGFSMTPGHCEEVPPGCLDVVCEDQPPPPVCPIDSALRLGHVPLGECCALPSRCECDPARCTLPDCPRGGVRVLVAEAQRTPGRCCDLHVCAPRSDARGRTCIPEDCPPVPEVTCPPGSFVALGTESHDGCCLLPARCECPVLCEKPTCDAGMVLRLVAHGNGSVESCCDEYECANDTRSSCTFNGMEHADGEMYRMDACRFCRCHNGVSFCFSAQCGALACQRYYVPEGECCPVCEDPVFPVSNPAGCFAKGQIRAHGDRWREDDCTFCQCVNGEHHCTATACGQSCLNPIRVPGECCPVCEEPTFITIRPPLCSPLLGCSLTDDSCPYGFWLDSDGCRTCRCKTKAEHCRSVISGCRLDCPHGMATDRHGCEVCQCRPQPKKCRHVACAKRCPNGYIKNKHGCDSCRCVKCPDLVCDKFCLHGYAENGKGCLLCRCKVAPGPPAPPVATGSCTSMDGRRYADGESWHDGCRDCYCQGGREMCALIACPVPRCPTPELRQGHCCPACADDSLAERPEQAPHAVCQAFGGEYYVEGQSWSADSCTQCTCHAGRVLCDTEVCPPLLCHDPVRAKGSCCLSCPAGASETPAPNGNGSSGGVGGVAPQYCVSEDGDIFLEGEVWKPNACESRVCREGRIVRFAERCPPVSCRRPVLRKGQCCPYCLEVIVPLKVCYYGDQIYGEGERWSPDQCTHCHCRNGEAVCIVEDCLRPSCSRPVRLDGSCCLACPDDELPSEPASVPAERSNEVEAITEDVPVACVMGPLSEDSNELGCERAVDGASVDRRGGGAGGADVWPLWVVIGALALGLLVVLVLLLHSRRRQWIPLQLYKPPVKTVYLNNDLDKNTAATATTAAAAAVVKPPLNNAAKVQRLAEPDPRYSGYYSMISPSGASV